MQIVIDIPEEQYSIILLSDKTALSEFASKEAMMYAIKEGTPLPKGHGRLVDADKVEDITWQEPSYYDALNVLTEVRDRVRALPTIIEADKKGAE